MMRPLSNLILWLVVGLLIASWPLTVGVVRFMGSPQPNWFADQRRGIVLLAQYEEARAIVLRDGSLVFVYPKWLEDPSTNNQKFHGYRSKFRLWPLTVMGIVLATYLGVLPVLRRYRRGKSGLCRYCAYPRMGASSDRCPECGEKW